jgi:antitoxin component YwqK of YwqJK toxin-antitoxin module
MSICTSCVYIISFGTQCGGKLFKDNYCVKHYRIRIRVETELPKDIITNIVSEYMSYNDIILVQDHIAHLKLNNDRILKKSTVDEKYVVKETYIDNVLREKIKYKKDDTKLYTQELYDENKKLHGKQISRNWYNWTLNDICHYFHGKLHGEYIKYDIISEQIERVTNYKDGIRDGIETKYNNKKISYTQEYKNDKKDGIYRLYSPVTGTINTEHNYKDDKLHGITKIYYPDGSPKIIFSYSEYLLDGLSCKYYPNGNIMEQRNYVSNAINGPCYTYYENGNLKSKEYWIKRKKKLNDNNYHDDEYELDCTTDDLTCKRCLLQFSYLEGVRYEYYEDGTLKYVQEYDEGKMVYERDTKHVQNLWLEKTDIWKIKSYP